MGWRNWLANKLIKVQVKQDNALQDALDLVIEQKIAKFRKEGKEVTAERLMKGWGSLKILGFSEEMVLNAVKARLKETK